MTQRFPNESQEAYKIRRAYEKTKMQQQLKGTVVTPVNSFNREKKRALEFHDVKNQLNTKIMETLEFGKKLNITAPEFVSARKSYFMYKQHASREWLESHLSSLVQIVKKNLPRE